MKKNKVIKIIFITILFTFLFLANKSFAAPSNIIQLYNGKEYYIVKAEENEIPRGFEIGKLSNIGVVVEAYKNGPLTIVKISDEEYNYKFIVVDEKNEGKPYELIIEKIDEVDYYIIPYQIEEYKELEKGLKPYKTMVKNQITTCYSINKNEYDKKVVFAVDSEKNLTLLTYKEEQDKFEIYDKITNEENEGEVNKDNSKKIMRILFLIFTVALVTVTIINQEKRFRNNKEN